ncbi:lysine--tRNA ligase, partial [bacterium]|nr:lysine--tRNA ligase [bacterium]
MPDDQRDPRVAKLDALVAKGIEPYGRRYDAPQSVADCLAVFDEQGDEAPVRTAGRLTAQRDFGKAAFLNLKDRTGNIQIYVRKNVIGEEAFEIYGLLDVG